MTGEKSFEIDNIEFHCSDDLFDDWTYENIIDVSPLV